MEGHTDSVRSVAITFDNKYIVSSGIDMSLIVWSLSLLKQEVVLQNHIGSVQTIAISSDNKYIASGGGDKIVRLWKLKDIIPKKRFHSMIFNLEGNF